MNAHAFLDEAVGTGHRGAYPQGRMYHVKTDTWSAGGRPASMGQEGPVTLGVGWRARVGKAFRDIFALPTGILLFLSWGAQSLTHAGLAALLLVALSLSAGACAGGARAAYPKPRSRPLL